MINREIPFRPRLEGEFRVRFYNAASEITEKTPTLTIARIAEREIEWVEKDCQYNIEQRKKYRAVWFLFRDLIRASWKACYRNGVIFYAEVCQCLGRSVDFRKQFPVGNLLSEVKQRRIGRMILIAFVDVFPDSTLRQRGVNSRLGVIFQPGLVDGRVSGQIHAYFPLF